MNVNAYNYVKRILSDLKALVLNQQSLTEWLSSLSEDDSFREVLIADLKDTAKAIDELSKKIY